MANPEPEITYKDAKEAGARVAGTGRSDGPNQVNNVLAFPRAACLRGSAGARLQITGRDEVGCGYALADLVSEDKLADDYVIPSLLR